MLIGLLSPYHVHVQEKIQLVSLPCPLQIFLFGYLPIFPLKAIFESATLEKTKDTANAHVTATRIK